MRWARVTLVLLGLVATEVVLIGPSLAGRKVLLPLDDLAKRNVWLPTGGGVEPSDLTMSDLVLQHEPFRNFGVAEVRAGRLPLWNPFNYCGSPLLANNQFAALSPFRLLDYAFPGPETLAWEHLLKTLVAGLGAYLFFSRAMKVGFWPAAVGAWCWPLTGFMVLWGLYPHSAVVAWLPWALLLTDGAVRRPSGLSAPGLALVTAAALVSGHSAMAGHLLLASGLYFLWCMIDEHGWRGLAGRPAWRSLAATAGGWGLGIMVSAPQTLPTAEYLQTSFRVASRLKGFVETPPVGPQGLLQFVFPYFFGTTHRDAIYLLKGSNLLEGPAQGFAGLFAWAFLAPLALGAAGRRSWKVLWVGLAVVCAGQVLDLPLLARVYQLNPLQLFRNNRFVFVTAFSALALAVMGLEVLRLGRPGFRRWHLLPVLGSAALLVTCLVRSYHFPLLDEVLARALQLAQRGAEVRFPLGTQEGSDGVRAWFAAHDSLYAGIALLVMLAWWATWRGWFARRGPRALLGALVVAELLAFAVGFQPQSEPSLYFSAIPVLGQLSRAPAGRVCGVACLPASLNLFDRLRDVRGYDAADPRAIVELMQLGADPHLSQAFSYAQVEWLTLRQGPIAALLGVRYLIHRGTAPLEAKPLFASDDYWVSELPVALPRVFVPRSVQTVNDKGQRLALLGSPDFDPAAVAYVESDPPLGLEGVEGGAQIVGELPTRVDVDVDLKTPGLVVLSDTWEKNWKAAFDGVPVEVLRADHALRGVKLPAGKGRLVFNYRPGSFYLGLKLSLAALVACAAWGLVACRIRRGREA